MCAHTFCAKSSLFILNNLSIKYLNDIWKLTIKACNEVIECKKMYKPESV